MHRSPRKLVGLGLIVFACGSPGELDETRFPEPGQTGYADDPARLGGSGAGGRGTGGSSTGGSGTGGSGTGGSGNGTGGTGTGGTGTGGTSGSGQGGSGAGPSTSCPDDIAVLFNRPGSEGGCEGGACHVPGGQRPDLTSPGVDARLLNVMSSCNGRPYISQNDSFLEDKLVSDAPDCGGYQMPFFMAAALNAADKQCILDWIDDVAAGM
jgi:hypothetical protein